MYPFCSFEIAKGNYKTGRTYQQFRCRSDWWYSWYINKHTIRISPYFQSDESQDVVKSRIQNTTRQAGVIPKYNWAYPALGVVFREEGFAALYKGFAPKVLRLGPGGGVLLVCRHI
jgi:hypothetical protein